MKRVAIVGVETRKRLIDATKLLSPDASEREIATAAGYKSARIIFLYFGSLENLKREAGTYLCNKEKIAYSGVSFSPQDISIGIQLPEEINEFVAEEAGIHAGDGSLHNPNGRMSYAYSVGGHPIEEQEFYNNHVKALFKKTYNLEVNPTYLSGGHKYGITFSSKAIFTFKNQVLGFPIGKKSQIVEVPAQIIGGDTKLQTAFLRGLADTDFSLSFQKKHKDYHYYPVIAGSFVSKRLVDQIYDLFRKMDFKVSKIQYPRPGHNIEYIVRMRGESSLDQWMDMISFKNNRHITKYKIWKKFGFCPAFTTLDERNRILAGEKDPYDFYKVIN